MPRSLARTGQYALVLWAALTLNFLLPHLAPGDPLDELAGPATALTPAQQEELRAQYGLDGGLAGQYGRYWADLARGDLGVSVRFARPVADLVGERLPWTLLLVGTGILGSALIGSLLGAVAAWRRGSRTDAGLLAGMVAADAMPAFWTGMLLVSAFAVQLGWLPSHGAVSLTGGGLLDVARHLVLPVTTIVLATVGGVFLLARASVVTTLDSAYVRMAEAKGAPPGRVLVRHALRNALLPVGTHTAVRLGVAVSGAVVVETVFAYPGLGRLVFEAAGARDYPLLQGAFLVLTVSVILANLAADLAAPLLDPRVRRPRRTPEQVAA